ncbi:MAG: hypothetical protein WCY12_05940 [Candidatus Omnitrophota bacterium]
MKNAAAKIPSRENLSLLLHASLVLIFSVAAIFLYASIKSHRQELAKKIVSRDVELRRRLNEEKRLVNKDLEEKYRADTVSYRAMEKRLKLEEQGARSAQLK